MNESTFTREVRHSIESIYRQRAFVKKIMGFGMQGSGLPDLIACIDGIYIGIECKICKILPSKDTSNLSYPPFSALQIFNLKAILVAGGIPFGLLYIVPIKKALIIYTPNLGLTIRKCDITTYNYIEKHAGMWNVQAMRNMPNARHIVQHPC